MFSHIDKSHVWISNIFFLILLVIHFYIQKHLKMNLRVTQINSSVSSKTTL